MKVNGDLAAMPFPELLQWIGGNGKTGLLEVEKSRICKRLVFSDGHVVATSSADPRELLGHFLVSRGQITEDLLRIALSQQETSSKPLGVTLVEMGVLSSEELVRNLSAQAEEILFSLFEWEDAVFRFEPSETPPGASHFPIDIRVDDILLRGMQRLDEVRRIREVFDDPRIVPERTEKLPPPEVFRNKVARRIYEAINGDRTVADILLHAHGSEYVVTKFLYELHRTGLVRIREVRPDPAASPQAAPSPTAAAVAAPAAYIVQPAAPAAPTAVAATPSPTPVAGAAAAATPDEAALEPAEGPAEATAFRTEFELELETARTRMTQGEFHSALEILDRLYQKHPENEFLRRLSREAETAFVDKAYKHYLPQDKFVALARPVESLEAENLTPQEFFLLSRIDGTWSIKSIIQIAPIREVDALRVLKRMREQGVIELRDAQDNPTSPG